MAEINFLTKKLKKGKLQEGFYYYELEGKKGIAGRGSLEACLVLSSKKTIKTLKVLGQVPSFEIIEQLCQADTDLHEAKKEIEELKKQNLLLSIANAELQDRYYSK